MELLTSSLVASYIAIAVLILKSGFDLWLNRFLFDREIEKGGDSLDALEKRNNRAKLTSTAAFAAMSLSIIIAIGATMKDSNESATIEDIKRLENSLSKHATRLKKIEAVIWPPTETGDYGSPTPTGPWDPVGMQDSLSEIKKELAELVAKSNVEEARLDRLIKIVNQLTENLERYEESIKQLKKFMPAPAG